MVLFLSFLLMPFGKAGHSAMVRFLAAAGGSVNIGNKVEYVVTLFFISDSLQNNAGPLFVAAQQGQIETVKTLVELGANTGAKSLV